ncbi:MAG: hypothetical protein ABR879_08230 [Methanomassiliicoccales archaeon]|jgi:primosomal protein N'
MDGYWDAMRSKGFGPDTMRAVRKTITCPNCGFVFSLTYARTFACRGCANSVSGCPKVRCAKCDHEFYLRQMSEVGDEYRERSLADHMGKVIDDYYDERGIAKKR